MEDTAVFKIQRRIEALSIEPEPLLASSLLAHHLNRKSVLGTGGRGVVIEQLSDFVQTERALRQSYPVTLDHLLVMAGLMREQITKNVERMRWILQEVKGGRIPHEKKQALLIELAQLEEDSDHIKMGLETIVESVTRG